MVLLTMKRILLFVILLSGLSACNPDPSVKWHEEWVVLNNSGQNLYVRTSVEGYDGLVEVGSSIVLKDASYYTGVEEEYLYCAKLWEYLELTEISIYSVDDEGLLKMWTVATDGEGRNFFDENEWRRTTEWYINAPNERTWVFEILPEDVSHSDY